MAQGREVFFRAEILEFALCAADVLAYFHSRRPPVYYGDLKPDNLMLSETGQLYLVDYGSAVFGYRRQQRTVMGTRGFAAPEQEEGFLDAGSDVYALGEKPYGSLGRKGQNRVKLLCTYQDFSFFSENAEGRTAACVFHPWRRRRQRFGRSSTAHRPQGRGSFVWQGLCLY